MATFTKLSSGSWRVQVRRKGRYVSETFLRRDDAQRWATEAERQIDRGETPSDSRIARLTTFEDLIDLHIDDMRDLGKAPLRSRAATLDLLRRQPGTCDMVSLDRWRKRCGIASRAGPMPMWRASVPGGEVGDCTSRPAGPPPVSTLRFSLGVHQAAKVRAYRHACLPPGTAVGRSPYPTVSGLPKHCRKISYFSAIEPPIRPVP